jgi:hypothetical protein
MIFVTYEPMEGIVVDVEFKAAARAILWEDGKDPS